MTRQDSLVFSKRPLHPLFRVLLALLATILALSCFVGCDGDEDPEKSSQSTPQNNVSDGENDENNDNNDNDGDVSVDAEPKKRVAITFDDGPQYYNDEETKKIVDELAKYGFTATFFVVGNRIPGGDALPYAVERGNEIGIHAFTHSHYYDNCTDSVYQNELQNTLNAIRKQIPDYEVKLMRPVGGRITKERVKTCPYAVIQWSVDSDDWNNKYVSGDTDEDTQKKIDTTVNNVMSTVSDGDIILMHDIWSNTYDATVILLAKLHEAGYEVVSVSELLGDELEAGKEYYSLYEIYEYE